MIPPLPTTTLDTERQIQLDSLISKNKAYSVFKKNPSLMSLFDHCKAIESDSSLLCIKETETGTEEDREEQRLSEGVATSSKLDTPRTARLGDDFTNLPKVEPPYLPPKAPNAPAYTLGLDLDETLIHYVDGNKNHGGGDADILLDADHEDEPCFFIRPGLNQLLTSRAHHYELVLYTAAMRDYADYFL